MANEDFVTQNGVLLKYIGTNSDVTIPNGIKYIGFGAFANCKSLTSISMPCYENTFNFMWLCTDASKNSVSAGYVYKFALGADEFEANGGDTISVKWQEVYTLEYNGNGASRCEIDNTQLDAISGVSTFEIPADQIEADKMAYPYAGVTFVGWWFTDDVEDITANIADIYTLQDYPVRIEFWGDEIVDIVGPLGKPTEIKKYGTVVCLAGGYGAAPCYLIAKAFKEAGNKVYMIMGARTKDLIFWQDKMKNASTELFITTDDGTISFHGMINPGVVTVAADAPTLILVDQNRLAVVSQNGAMKGLRGYFTLSPEMASLALDGRCYLSVSKPTPTDVEVLTDPQPKARQQVQKIMRNGQIFIIRDGETYTITGQKVR